MNLSDMLSYADISQLTRIASVYGCECNGNSKHELIQSILATVHRQDILKAKLELMDIEELRFVNVLMFEARKGYSLEDLLAKVQQCRFQHEAIKQQEIAIPPEKKSKRKKRSKTEPVQSTPRDVIAKFKQQGWLFNGHGATDRYLFHVPQDLKERFKLTLTEVLTQSMTYVAAPSQLRDEAGMLLKDMQAMLHYIYTYTPIVAADGIMHRRFVQQLSDQFSIKEQLPGKGAWKFGYGKGFGEYSDRMAFMYDYMYANRWLEIADDRLVLTELGKKQLSELNESVMPSIVQHWLKLYKGSIPNLAALYYWVCSLSKEWTTLQSLQQAIEPIIRPFYFDSAEAILHKRVVKMLLHFGMLQLSETEQGTIVRLSNYGRTLFSAYKG